MSWFHLDINDFARVFLSVLFEGVPFLLLGSLISGLVDVFVSSERMQRLLPANSAAAIGISGLLGLIFPMCECGSVIVIRRFIKKGLPLSSAVTYMLAAPIVSPLVALSTFAAFKGQNPWIMTSLRLSIGYLIAVTVGFIVHRLRASTILQPGAMAPPAASRRAALSFSAMPTEQQDFSTIVASSSAPKKFLLALQSATADFLDVAFYFIIGTAAASVFNTGLNQKILDSLATNPPVAIASLMGFAVLLAVCSTTDAFIAAASFIKFPFAAKLGFLLFGPVFDLKLFWLYGILFKRRFVVLLGLGLFLVIWLISWRIAGLHLDAPMGALPR
jgi:uncharacterized membrane protein YraQ (UPF0718 family)